MDGLDALLSIVHPQQWGDMFPSLPTDLRDWVQATLGPSSGPVVPVWQGDTNTVYRLGAKESPHAYLKIGPQLSAEEARLRWLADHLADHLPVPRLLGFLPGPPDALLLSPLPGEPLSSPRARATPTDTARLMGRALRHLHDSNASDCPFGTPVQGAVFTHGDACLPNILVQDGGLSGYLDLGESGLALPCVDLSAALWSLQFNLGPGHARAFLSAYGLDLSEADIEDLRRRYHDP